MSQTSILLPSKIHIVKEEGTLGVYEIENLYPGYGHTLGNSLRRIVLSSIPGAGITQIKITGADHEFSTLDGMKEDVIIFLLNLKKVRFKLTGGEKAVATLSIKGAQKVHAKDIQCPGQLEVLIDDQYLCELTSKTAHLEVEITVEHGLGFVPRDVHHKQKAEIGVIALDALFSPIRRVSYEVENMRVGDKTNHNKLRMIIETDGTLTPREALEKSIETMMIQLQAISGFKTDFQPITIEHKTESLSTPIEKESVSVSKDEDDDSISDVLKTRIDTLDFTARTLKALTNANIRTIGGIARKRADDLLEIEGIGEKGIAEIKKVLGDFNIQLK